VVAAWRVGVWGESVRSIRATSCVPFTLASTAVSTSGLSFFFFRLGTRAPL
jgi:hypothetical protein